MSFYCEDSNYALELFNTCNLAERVATESKCQQSKSWAKVWKKCEKIIQSQKYKIPGQFIEITPQDTSEIESYGLR